MITLAGRPACVPSSYREFTVAIARAIYLAIICAVGIAIGVLVVGPTSGYYWGDSWHQQFSVALMIITPLVCVTSWIAYTSWGNDVDKRLAIWAFPGSFLIWVLASFLGYGVGGLVMIFGGIILIVLAIWFLGWLFG